jgi:DNA polymerase III alpha subunit
MIYAELQVTTHFSFLRGASSPAELFEQARLLGITALGIVDRNSLAGIVRAYEASRETGVRLIVGCRLDLVDGTSVLVYPTDRRAYSRLCRLLSIGKSRGGKGKCLLTWDDVAAWNGGLLAILLGGGTWGAQGEPGAPQGNLRWPGLHGADPTLCSQRASPALLRRADGASVPYLWGGWLFAALTRLAK